MTSVSNVSIGAKLAGAAAADARHGMNEAIARLSTGVRSMYGGDAAGQSMADNLKARGLSVSVVYNSHVDLTAWEYKPRALGAFFVFIIDLVLTIFVFSPLQ